MKINLARKHVWINGFFDKHACGSLTLDSGKLYLPYNVKLKFGDVYFLVMVSKRSYGLNTTTIIVKDHSGKFFQFKERVEPAYYKRTAPPGSDTHKSFNYLFGSTTVHHGRLKQEMWVWPNMRIKNWEIENLSLENELRLGGATHVQKKGNITYVSNTKINGLDAE